jgi:rubredoxin
VRKYVCGICGFLYDESSGYPDGGIAPGTKWEGLPENWVCPLCGASKDEFVEQKTGGPEAKTQPSNDGKNQDPIRELSFNELSALCSNLSKGCEKQYRSEEADLFRQLAEYYSGKGSNAFKAQVSDLVTLIEADLSSGYENANRCAAAAADRGSLRALTWGEKVSRILSSLISRYEKQGDALLENTHVYVCEICGFVYIGDEAPEICPVCKVPNLKIAQIQRR